MANTRPVVTSVSLRDGQVTLDISDRTSRMNFAGSTATPIQPSETLGSVRCRQKHRTEPSSLFYRVIHVSGDSTCDDHALDCAASPALLRLAGVEGLEPPASGFGDRRSSQLSYTPARQAGGSANRAAPVTVHAGRVEMLRKAPSQGATRLRIGSAAMRSVAVPINWAYGRYCIHIE